MKRGSKPGWVKELARKRILKLLKMAEENANNHPERSRRYVELAVKISKRYNVPIPPVWKKRFCKKCNTFWTTDTLRIRMDSKNKRKVYLCTVCGTRKVLGYARKSTS